MEEIKSVYIVVYDTCEMYETYIINDSAFADYDKAFEYVQIKNEELKSYGVLSINKKLLSTQIDQETFYEQREKAFEKLCLPAFPSSIGCRYYIDEKQLRFYT